MMCFCITEHVLHKVALICMELKTYKILLRMNTEMNLAIKLRIALTNLEVVSMAGKDTEVL